MKPPASALFAVVIGVSLLVAVVELSCVAKETPATTVRPSVFAQPPETEAPPAPLADDGEVLAHRQTVYAP